MGLSLSPLDFSSGVSCPEELLLSKARLLIGRRGRSQKCMNLKALGFGVQEDVVLGCEARRCQLPESGYLGLAAVTVTRFRCAASFRKWPAAVASTPRLRFHRVAVERIAHSSRSACSQTVRVLQIRLRVRSIDNAISGSGVLSLISHGSHCEIRGLLVQRYVLRILCPRNERACGRRRDVRCHRSKASTWPSTDRLKVGDCAKQAKPDGSDFSVQLRQPSCTCT